MSYQGKSVTQWARQLGISKSAFRRRVTLWGWPRAVSTPLVRPSVEIVLADGRRFPSMRALAEDIGVRPGTLSWRVHVYGSIDVAVQMGSARRKTYVHAAWSGREIQAKDLRKVLLKRLPGIEILYPGLLRSYGFLHHLRREEREMAQERRKSHYRDLTDLERGEAYFRLEHRLRKKQKNIAHS